MIRVLHVDDEVSFLDLSSFFLKREGDFEVDTAANAESALEKMQSQDYDAVVADYSLPGMDGIEMLKIVRAKGLQIPFILFTGKGGEEAAVEALNHGADFYLRKGSSPQIQFTELANLIRKSVRSTRSDQAAREGDRFISSVFSSIQDGISVLDKDLNIVRVNPAMEDWYSHKMPLVGKKCYDAYHGRQAHCEVCPSLETIENERPAYEVVPKIGAKGEVVGWLDLYAFPMRDSKTGELSGVIEYVRDITDRRKAELELHSALERYKELQGIIDKGPVILVIWRPEPGGPVSFISDGIAQFGYRREDFVSTFVYDDIIHKEDLEREREEFRDFVKKGVNDFVQEYRIATKSGEVRWVEDHTYVRRDHDGNPVGYEGIVIDVSARKLAQQKSEELASKLQAIVGAFPDLYFHVDAGGRVLDYNAGRVADLYVPPEEFLGKRLQDVLPPDVGKMYGDTIDEAVKTGRVLAREYSLEIEGETRFFEARLIPIPKEHALIVVRNITASKVAEEALRKSEEKYRQLVELAQEGILMTDAEAVVRFANPRMAEMIGISVDEMVGKSLFQFMDEQAAELSRRKIEDIKRGLFDRYELDFLRKDGTLLHANVGVTPIKDKAGRYSGALGVVTDISDRKRHEAVLEVANRKLNLLNHVTRHDALNQLSVLIGWLQLAQETASEPPVQEYLKKIWNAAEIMRKQLDFTGDYQKMGVAKPEWIDVKTAVLNGISGLSPSNISKSVQVEGLEVLADLMFEKVFNNLVDNSLRHGGKVTKIGIRYEESDDRLSIVYEDDGVGIPTEEKEKLFQRGRGKHSGYGLFMVKEILGITGITITETGKPGKGARFVISIPRGAYRISKE
ncbi:MAG: PAS domain S-box protein [Thermoplasmatota archaeon]|nr:PAS domain S-box protein [Candidatus Thermoplasmatota archaeon]MBU1914152.1 PAS domain S-box protein [Candidatus Thermoplasmatota archaeon]